MPSSHLCFSGIPSTGQLSSLLKCEMAGGVLYFAEVYGLQVADYLLWRKNNISKASSFITTMYYVVFSLQTSVQHSDNWVRNISKWNLWKYSQKIGYNESCKRWWSGQCDDTHGQMSTHSCAHMKETFHLKHSSDIQKRCLTKTLANTC